MSRPRATSRSLASSRPYLTAVLWLLAYLAIVLAPVGALLLAPTPPGGGFWWDVSMGLGFAGLTMMAIQFVLTARFKHATAPFGIDVIYAFHRYLSYGLLALILLHPVILVVRDPAQISAIVTPWAAPPEVSAGTVSLALLLVIVGVSVFRKQLRLAYEWWRATHLFLSLAALGFAFLHLRGVSHYTSAPAIGWLWVAIGGSVLWIVFFVRILRPWRLLSRPYRVTGVLPEPGSSWALMVEPEGHSGFPFQAGQFAWLTVGRSPFVMHEHPFSIASSPRDDGRMEFVIKELGDFTSTVGTIPAGTRAYVDGPYGSFSMDRHPEAPGYVFLAGGIGVAPMAGMLRALADRADPRPHFCFAAHSGWDRIPLRDELARLRKPLDLQLVHVLEELPGEGAGPTGPDGVVMEEGWITPDLLRKHLPPEGIREAYHYFICGPVPMIRAMEAMLKELRISPMHVHTELFDMV